MPDERDTVKKQVERVVDELFKNADGQEGLRLVITSAEGKDLGGWCKQSVVDRIMDGIYAAAQGLVFDQAETALQSLQTMRKSAAAHGVKAMPAKNAKNCTLSVYSTFAWEGAGQSWEYQLRLGRYALITSQRSYGSASGARQGARLVCRRLGLTLVERRAGRAKSRQPTAGSCASRA